MSNSAGVPPPPTASNRLGLDYRRESAGFLRYPGPIVDSHCHIVGGAAARVYADAARAYGVGLSYSMTPIPGAPAVREALGERVRFISVPNWSDPDRARAHREGFLDCITRFHAEFGSRTVKLWNAPRLRDLLPGEAGRDLITFDAPWRVRIAEHAAGLGMMFLVHVADPDTWFRTSYADRARYGAKREHYESLERMLERFRSIPWIAAHMGGSPEDLGFLDGLLSRHSNLHLDTSAAKWMVRELSRHPRDEFAAFIAKWQDRVIFGSDIVTSDDHLSPSKRDPRHPKADQADSPESAFDLYASRFWALRTLFERTYDAESPIADPDLAMVDPTKHDAMSAPPLRGFAIGRAVLEKIMHANAERVIGGWWASHP